MTQGHSLDRSPKDGKNNKTCFTQEGGEVTHRGRCGGRGCPGWSAAARGPPSLSGSAGWGSGAGPCLSRPLEEHKEQESVLGITPPPIFKSIILTWKAIFFLPVEITYTALDQKWICVFVRYPEISSFESVYCAICELPQSSGSWKHCSDKWPRNRWEAQETIWMCQIPTNKHSQH